MNFQESVAYLYGLGNEVLAMKLGLENISKLLAALGNPQNNFLKIQVAGTNGKGSTCAFLDSICVSTGIKTGLYTSPHLVSITERIKIGGQEISEKDFARHASKIREISEKLVETGDLETVPTFFEQVTAIALSVFAEAKIKLAILETGLGGRFDATTAVNAEIVAITPIDYDHQDILGETLAEIAAEKAAIIRQDTRVILAPQSQEVETVILKKCREKGVEPIVNCRWIEENSNEVFYKTNNEYYLADLSLKGDHQRNNACVAILIAEVLAKDFKFDIGNEEIEKGLETAEHRGRLEFYKGILFDGSHNIAGAKALRNYLQKYYTNANITLIFGAMKDKNILEIGEILFPSVKDLILTKPDNPRSAEVAELNICAEKFIDNSKISLIPNVADAIDSAIQINSTYSRARNSIICLTGSLYLVGEAQKILKANLKFDI
jgi:dihydrofolate synthase/folylpolyglutamate synthase